MSKIDVGLILGKSFTVLKKQPFIFLPFIVLAFLFAGFMVITFSYTIEMTQALQSFSSEYQYNYTASPSEVFQDMTGMFRGMANLFIISMTGSFLLLIIQSLVYAGAVSMAWDVIEGRTTSIESFINALISKGITVILSTIAALLIVFLPGIMGIFILLIGALSMSEAVITIAVIFFISQIIWLLAILFLLSSKIPRIVYAIITALTAAFIILGIFFIPVLLLAIPFFFLLFILVMISMIIISFTIDYVIPSAVVIDNTGVVDSLKKSFTFAEEHTLDMGFLIVIAVVLSIAASTPFMVFSFALQMESITGSDFSGNAQVYVPTTSDLIIQIIQTFIITGFLTPVILLMFVLGYVNAVKGKEILEKLN